MTNSLDQLPLDAVLPLSESLEALARDLILRDIPVVEIDLSGATTKNEVLLALAHALGLPDYFGGNFDALYECLIDMEVGRLIIVRGLRDDADGMTLLTVFRDAAHTVAQQGFALRVFFELKEEGGKK